MIELQEGMLKVELLKAATSTKELPRRPDRVVRSKSRKGGAL